MKNTNKIISLVVLLVLVAATVAGAYLGIAGRNTTMVTVRENGEDVERALYRQVAFIPNTVNKNWTEAITPSAALNGGYSYTLTAEQGDMSDADFAKAVKNTAKIVGNRAEMLAGDAAVAVDGATITLTVPQQEYDYLIPTVATPVGEITFCLYNAETGMLDEPLLTAKDVKDAGYYADSYSYYYLQVELSKKAIKTLNEHLGETLYIVQDGSAIAYTTLSAALDTNYLSASVSDWTQALTAAVCLRTDVLPFTLTLENYAAAEATMPGLLDTIIVVCGIVVLLAAVWMVIRARATGLTGVLTLIAQVVVFCLCMALIAISAAWKLTLPSLILILVCELLFIGGLLCVMESIARSQKHRALSKAAPAVMGKLVKPLGIVYLALVVLGLLLMGLYNTYAAGILGRIIAVSGLINFVMIFVFLRVVIACVCTLKKNK